MLRVENLGRFELLFFGGAQHLVWGVLLLDTGGIDRRLSSVHWKVNKSWLASTTAVQLENNLLVRNTPRCEGLLCTVLLGG
jgi:hypothetical protein